MDLSAEPAGHFNRAYLSLLAAPEQPSAEGEPVAGKYVHPGQARTSYLIWRLYGRNTSRQWDATYNPGQMIALCPPSEAKQLTDDEKLTFMEWIDLGAHWDGIPGPDEFSGNANDSTGSKDTR